MATSISVSVERDRDQVVLQCSGELDLSTAGSLDVAVQAALATAPAGVRLDASRLAFVDVAGVHAIVQAARRCGDAGVRAAVVVNRQTWRLLHLLDMTPLIGTERFAIELAVALAQGEGDDVTSPR